MRPLARDMPMMLPMGFTICPNVQVLVEVSEATCAFFNLELTKTELLIIKLKFPLVFIKGVGDDKVKELLVSLDDVFQKFPELF